MVYLATSIYKVSKGFEVWFVRLQGERVSPRVRERRESMGRREGECVVCVCVVHVCHQLKP